MAGIEQFFRRTNKTNDNSTESFIQNYLNPEMSFIENTPYWKQYQLVCGMKSLNNEMIYDHIQSMEYHDFLQTPYWKAISNNLKKGTNFTCELCDYQEQQIHVHHKNYYIHGLEHLKQIQDRFLIVLCGECHEMLHDTYGYDHYGSVLYKETNI